MSFLSIDHLNKTYHKSTKKCLNDLSLDVEQGEIISILGPSGCGKTTLLKLIAGLEGEDSGSISIDGVEINNTPTEKRPIAMVFQKPYLFKNMTVKDNIGFSPRINGMFKTKQELNDEIQRYVDIVKLTGLEDRLASQLSGGQEQRVSLARALILKPKVLLLDEPLSALDANLRLEMRANIRNICKELGQTVIFVTHDQEEAVAVGDRIALLEKGSIVQCSSPEEFYRHPNTASVAKFFGWRNMVPSKYDGNGKLVSSIGTYAVDGYVSEAGPKLMVMRPEAFYENANGPIKGIVKQSCFMGVRVDYTIDANGQELFVSLDSSYLRRPGETIQLDINRSGVWAVDVEDAEEEDIIEPKKNVIKKLISKMKKKEN